MKQVSTHTVAQELIKWARNIDRVVSEGGSMDSELVKVAADLTKALGKSPKNLTHHRKRKIESILRSEFLNYKVGADSVKLAAINGLEFWVNLEQFDTLFDFKVAVSLYNNATSFLYEDKLLETEYLDTHGFSCPIEQYYRNKTARLNA